MLLLGMVLAVKSETGARPAACNTESNQEEITRRHHCRGAMGAMSRREPSLPTIPGLWRERRGAAMPKPFNSRTMLCARSLTFVDATQPTPALLASTTRDVMRSADPSSAEP